MTEVLWPSERNGRNARIKAMALAWVGILASIPVCVCAKPFDAHLPQSSQALASKAVHSAGKNNAAPPVLSASGPIVPADLDHGRDGHMTPDERRLLRQHIEDAARDLYKR
jgi:hypothetical protein